MEFHRVRYFLEVVRQCSFSKAALACHVSQPSMSQQIKKLEEQLGEVLFRRLRDGIKLTDFGEEFLPYARKIMNDIHAAVDFSHSYQKEIRGEIRIGAIPTIAPYLIPQLITKTTQKHSQIEFLLFEETTDVLIQLLRSGSIDIALMSPPFTGEKETNSMIIGEDELLITLPTQHRFSNRQAIALKDLESEPMVLMKDTHCLSQQSIKLCERSGIHPKVNVQSSQLDTVLSLVESGMGITFTPRMAIPFHTTRAVTYHSIKPLKMKRSIAFVWLRLQSLTRAQKAFLNMVENENFVHATTTSSV